MNNNKLIMVATLQKIKFELQLEVIAQDFDSQHHEARFCRTEAVVSTYYLA